MLVSFSIFAHFVFAIIYKNQMIKIGDNGFLIGLNRV
nr:MAG TPA_asm: hypothetical protein [Caudoviricetes sp.]